MTQADDPREDHRSLARSQLGRGDRPCRLANSSASRPSTAASSIGAITSSRCTNEEVYRGAEAGARRPSATTMSTPAPASAIRRPATACQPRSAPPPARRISSRSTQADVILVIGANPTDGHPVVRLADEEAAARRRQADRRRSARHRPGALAPHQGRLSSAAAARNQCGAGQRARPCRRHRRAGERSLCARTLRCRRVRNLGAVHRAGAEFAGGRWSSIPACRRPTCARRRGFTPAVKNARDLSTASA